MPKVTVCNSQNEQVGEIELDDEIFNVPIKSHLVHEGLPLPKDARRCEPAVASPGGKRVRDGPVRVLGALQYGVVAA